jgi:hypothetical protein
MLREERPLARDPLEVIAECLGEPADLMRNPANAEYRCPFSNKLCSKSSNGVTAPVCAIYRRGAPGGNRRVTHPICICPTRFYEANIPADVVRECWEGPRPANPRVVYEVSMQKFGKVDLVIADVDEDTERVRKFLPVELQAVDITGSVFPDYQALISSQLVTEPKGYGINWANVRKRFLSQLVAKGYYCHHWGTRIVAVVQTDLFERFHAHARLAEVSMRDANIVFMLYQFRSRGDPGHWTFQFERLAPTTHTNVMNAVLYETPPVRAKFEARILRQIRLPI